jgi:hypothetical protein
MFAQGLPGNLGDRAAMLADVPASESLAGGNCPVATVAISGDAKGDQSVGSPEVKASEREANNSAGCSKGEPISPEMVDIGSAEPLVSRRRQALVAKELGICSDRLPGDVGDDMLRRNGQRKHGTTHRWPRPVATTSLPPRLRQLLRPPTRQPLRGRGEATAQPHVGARSSRGALGDSPGSRRRITLRKVASARERSHTGIAERGSQCIPHASAGQCY